MSTVRSLPRKQVVVEHEPRLRLLQHRLPRFRSQSVFSRASLPSDYLSLSYPLYCELRRGFVEVVRSKPSWCFEEARQLVRSACEVDRRT